MKVNRWILTIVARSDSESESECECESDSVSMWSVCVCVLGCVSGSRRIDYIYIVLYCRAVCSAPQ